MTLINDLIFNFPTVSKPPFDLIYNEEVTGSNKTAKTVGVTLQFALAGMKKKDISVHAEGRNLFIDADNTYDTTVSRKFTNKFNWRLVISEELDINKCEVDFENGLLQIILPVSMPSSESKVLF